MSRHGYAPALSFECDPVTTVAAGTGLVALGTAGGTVEIVADDRASATVEEPPADLAVGGGRVYALCPAELVALSTDGTRVWSVELAGGTAVAATPDGERVAVATDDSLVGFDGERGVRRFEAPRPRADVAADALLVGGPGGFAHATWSFLTLLDGEGEVTTEASLGGATRAVGWLDEVAVVSLRGDRLTGVDTASGDARWEGEVAAPWLPATGDGHLLVPVEGRLVRVAPDGSTDRLADLPAGEAYVATDGGLVCAVADGTVSVHRERDPLDGLTATVESPTVVAGEAGSLAVTLANDGDVPVDATLVPAGDGVATTDDAVPVEVPAGEATTVEVDVDATGLDAGDPARLALAAGGTELLAADLAVRSDEPVGDLSTEASLAAVEDGTARVALDLENAGEERLDDLTVSGGPGGSGDPADDRTLAGLAPSERTALRLDSPFLAGETVSWTVESGAGLAVPVALDLPAEPVALSIADAEDGFADVRVENRTGASLRDRIVVTGDGVPDRLARRLSLDPGGALVIALRPVGDGEASLSAALDGLGVSRSGTVEGQGPPARDGTGPAEGRPDQASGGAGARADSAGPDSGDEGATAGRGTAPEPPDDGRDRPALSVSRSTSTARPREGEGFEERVVVVNETDRAVAGATLRTGGDEHRIGTLQPGERVERARIHAVADRDEVELPTVEVSAEDSAPATAPARSLDVEPAAAVVARAVVERDGQPTARVRVFNRSERDCALSRIGLHGLGVWQVDLRVGPGEGVEWTEPLETDPDRPAVRTAVEYDLGGGTVERVGTLAAVERDGADPDGLDALDLSVSGETQVVGRYGTVVLGVANRGGRPLRDVTVEASGEAVSETMYGGRDEAATLGPGESIEHFVDVHADGRSVAVDVSLSATDDDVERRVEATVRGPVAADDAGWTPETLDAWTVDGLEGDAGAADSRGAGGMAFPSHVTSEFRPE